MPGLLNSWCRRLDGPALSAQEFVELVEFCADRDAALWDHSGPVRAQGRTLTEIDQATGNYRRVLDQAAYDDPRIEAARVMELRRMRPPSDRLRVLHQRAHATISELSAASAAMLSRATGGRVSGAGRRPEVGLGQVLASTASPRARAKLMAVWRATRAPFGTALAARWDELAAAAADSGRARTVVPELELERYLRSSLDAALRTADELLRTAAELGFGSADPEQVHPGLLLAASKPGPLPVIGAEVALTVLRSALIDALGIELSHRGSAGRWSVELAGPGVAAQAEVEFVPWQQGMASNTLGCVNRGGGSGRGARAWIQCRATFTDGSVAPVLSFQQVVSLAHELGHVISHGAMGQDICALNSIEDLDPTVLEAVSMACESIVLSDQLAEDLARAAKTSTAMIQWTQGGRYVEMCLSRVATLVSSLIELRAGQDSAASHYARIAEDHPLIAGLVPLEDVLISLLDLPPDGVPNFAYETGRSHAAARTGSFLADVGDTLSCPPTADPQGIDDEIRQGVRRWAAASSGFRTGQSSASG
ncbi:hypothetical protein GCM10009554_62040 [Kribbella koreensis]|uniref:Peptidase M3-like protein n=1 Tax=Kribbella koreensis TaxID=57909 RepID=A0ABN1RD96_9ACTN